MKFLPVQPATFDELANFHDHDYLRCLEQDGFGADGTDFGLAYDCYPFKGLAKHVSYVAGGTLTAANFVCKEKGSSVAIHWDGGRHHAIADSASGFCFANDAVLGLFAMQECFNKILYIDIDAHHGDGVELAFRDSSSVVTCSFHLCMPGIYPNTGQSSCLNNFNYPFTSNGFCAKKYTEQFISTVNYMVSEFSIDAIMFLVGGDLLVHDPLVKRQIVSAGGSCPNGFGLNVEDYGRLLEHVLSFGLPTVLLGGGGYHETNVPLLYAYLTAVCALEKESFLQETVPEHSNWASYAQWSDCTLKEIIKDLNNV